MSTLIGLIIIAVGGYFAWEAHSVLESSLFQMGVYLTPHGAVTSRTLEVFNSPAVDVSYQLGANTASKLETYLSVMRIGGVVVVLGGLGLAISGFKSGD